MGVFDARCAAPVAPHPHVVAYRAMIDSRSDGELATIASTKRFIERFLADAAWRKALRTSPERADSLFDEKGITLDPGPLATLWSSTRVASSLAPPDEGSPSGPAPGHPLRLWQDWNADLAQVRALERQLSITSPADSPFERWRMRQVRRSSMELGAATTGAMSHPIVAYELSRGCSVGCWFCGVSASRFAGHVPYTEANAFLWQAIVRAMAERFGAAAATGFCYWATDPSDNPDYCRFMEDHACITGTLPHTTMASPLRHLDLTRKILATSARYKHGNDRFSILSLGMLDRLHATFDARDLLTVDLVLQMKGALTPRARAGRAWELADRLRRAVPEDMDPFPTQGSIACVTGFIVNLVERTVRMVSPCAAAPATPDGYYVFGERRFDDGRSFGVAIDDLIKTIAGCGSSGAGVLALHAGLRTWFDKGALVLSAPDAPTLKVMPFRFLPALVDCLRKGGRSFAGVVESLADDFPSDRIAIGMVLQDLFDHGVFVETPRRPAGLVESEPGVANNA